MRRKRAILFAALAVIGLCSGATSAAASAEEGVPTVFDLTDEATLNANFSSIYVEDKQTLNGEPVAFSDAWEIVGDTLRSKRLETSGTEQTNLIRMLTLRRLRYTNFEARLTFSYQSENPLDWGYPGLVFRQEKSGAGYLADGGLALVTRTGDSQYWGSDANGGGGPHLNPDDGDTSAPVKEYVLHLKVFGDNLEMEVLDGSDVVSSLTKHGGFDHPFRVRAGFVSVASCGNKIHNFKRLEIREIGADGTGNGTPEPYTVPSSIELKNAPTAAMRVGQELFLDVGVNAGANAEDLRFFNSDPDVAVVSGGTLTCIGAGQTTVKVSSVFDPNLSRSFSLQVRGSANKEGYVNYRLVSENALDAFVPYYIENNKVGYRENSWRDHWTYNAESQSVRRSADIGNGVDGHHAALYPNLPLYTENKYSEIRYYEAQFVYRNPSGKDGWIGVLGGNTSQASRFLENGYAAFVQANGMATLWGKDTGGPYEAATAGYDRTAWHVLKVRVFGSTTEIYVDGMKTPVFSRTGNEAAQGRIGIFTSGSDFEIKQISVGVLSADGSLRPYLNLGSIAIADKIQSAQVGDVFDLKFDSDPAGATLDIVSVSTSDSNVCVVNKSTGKLSFIGAGTVTVEVASMQYPELKDTMTVEVRAKDPVSGPSSRPAAGNSSVWLPLGIAVFCAGILAAAGLLVFGLVRRKK